jgi:hypothetical protein
MRERQVRRGRIRESYSTGDFPIGGSGLADATQPRMLLR